MGWSIKPVHRKSQVERQLKKWKFEKNINENGIAYLSDQVARRIQDGLETDVFLSARLIPRSTWQRKIQRRFISTTQRLLSSKLRPLIRLVIPKTIVSYWKILTWYLLETPSTPQDLDLSISTPAPLPMYSNSWPLELPWLKSQPSISTSTYWLTIPFFVLWSHRYSCNDDCFVCSRAIHASI